MFNRKIGTISWKIHYPYEGMYPASDIEYIEKTVTGNGYVDLLTAKSGSLSNLTLFGGTEQDDTDVIQSVVLDGATAQRNVPEGYTELDYLKNVMNSTKFNTGLSPQNGDVLELVWTAGSPSVSNYMFQSREGTAAGIYGISGSSSGGTIMGNRGSGQSVQSEILRTNGHKYYTKMSIIGTTLTLTVKDLTDKTEDTRTREITETAGGPSKYFLRGNATGSQAIGTAQNVYYASITTNGVERIKLIPAKQGDTVGFYDMVSKTFMSTFVGSTPTASTAEATAHPYVPMDIVGNNGAIKVHKNLIDKSTIVRGDISAANGDINGVTYRAVSDFIPILNGQTYTLSGTLYQIGQETPKNANCIYALYDSNKAYITGSRVTSTNTFTIDNANASYIRVERYPTGTDELIMENSEFQFQVGAYKTAYESETGAYIEGVTETVQDSKGNTATADFLMGLSSYKDTQEVLTGNITKNTTYKILDGTEARYVNGDIPFFRLGSAIPNGVGTSSDTLKCTHFPYSGIGGTNENQGIRVYNNALFVRYDSLAPATADGLVAFKKFLSDQYAQGTPMIVACGLSVSQTSSVAGQELIEAPVTQTAGSISNMTITVTSDGGEPTPSTPQDIICNNGILKYNTTTQTIYTEGDIETVEDELGNTATAEMLLKIGDYADEQEVLSGTVTRRIGIKVFDGTEEREEASATSGRYRYTLTIPYLPAGIVYSTHFKGGKTISELNADSTITQAATSYSNKIYIYTATYSTLSDFKSFLATQYANGTPVIVIYPLATATTESVEGQNLNVQSGTNKIEITQASIDNLGISATYLSRE